MPTDHQIELHDHEHARLKAGGNLLIARPIVPQPVYIERGLKGFWVWPNIADNYDDTTHLKRGLMLSCRYRPGDGLVVGAMDVKDDCRSGTQRCHECDDLECRDNLVLRLIVQRAEARRVQGLTAHDWAAAGFNPPVLGGCNMAPFPEKYAKWNEQRREEWIEMQARTTYMARCLDVQQLIDCGKQWWDATYARLGKQYAWERAWVWMITAAEAAGEG